MTMKNIKIHFLCSRLIMSKNFYEANEIIKSKSIKLKKYDELLNEHYYTINDMNCEILIKFDNEEKIIAKCSCHNELINITSDTCECEKLLSVILYHFKIDKDVYYTQNKLIKFQQNMLEKINNKTFVSSNDEFVSSVMQMIIYFKLDKLFDYVNNLNTSLVYRFIEQEFNCFNKESINFILDYYCTFNANINSKVIVEAVTKQRENLSETFVMNNIDYIEINDEFKIKNPHLFDPKKQSIAFKMFLLMKGV